MRRVLTGPFIGLLLLASGCASDSGDATVAGGAVTTVAAQLTTFTEPEAAESQDEPREGSVADLESPIGILEGGMTFDPEWRADVTLGCGPDADSRLIEAFDVDTNERGTAALSVMIPSGGGFKLDPVEVGSVVPVDVRLSWNIPGILLGPWEVDTLTDTCDLG